MSFLQQIVASKNSEIAAAKKERSIGYSKRLIRVAESKYPVQPFGAALAGSFGIIAEVKRKSPSAGEMLEDNHRKAPAAYARSPIVKAVSVLTETAHFGMRIENLSEVREVVRKPVLRKDFIFTEYQVLEARAFGADAILLMANLLKPRLAQQLFDLAKEQGMEVLYEIHDKDEISSIPKGATICGVNSRKFKARWTFTKAILWLQKRIKFTPPNKALDPTIDPLAFSLIDDLDELADGVIKVAESGVRPNKISQIRDKGFHAALIGTSLLKHPAGVEAALSEFQQALRVPEERTAHSPIVPAHA